MNKYVLRTSLVWIAVLAVVVGIWTYRSHSAKQPMAMKMPMSGDVQPVASGPPAGDERASAIHAGTEDGNFACSCSTHARANAEHRRKTGLSSTSN